MMIRRRRAVIVGLAVGAAAANRRHEQEMQRQQQQTVVVTGYPQTTYNPYYPNTVQVVQVPPARSTGNTTVVVTAPPQPPRSGYPPSQLPPPGQGPYPPQGYPPGQGPYQPQGYPPGQGSYPPQGYPPQPIYPPSTAPPPYELNPAADAANAAAAAAAIAAEAERRQREVERRYFMIVSEANCSVLEIDPGSGRPGSRLVLNELRPDKPPRQMWYQDHNSVIRSMVHDYALEWKGADSIVLMPYTGEAKQRWTFKANRIVNETRPGECIGLKKRLFLHDDADVIVSKYDKKPYQHWRIDYA